MNILSLIRSDASGFAVPVASQPFSGHFYLGYPVVDLDGARESHTMLGFGASFTDAACHVIDRLPDAAQAALLRDLFAPDGLNLSIGRLNVGSSDYATRVYSYNDVPGDVGMQHFSIDPDRRYLIPLLRRVKALRTDLFLFSSPWSPPGWMKLGGSMCGGYLKREYLPAFADYYVAYLKAYREAGVPIDALTLQNEADTDQGGRMPASILHPEYEMELIGRLLPPRLKAAGLDTRIWMYDHNYSGWRRVLAMLDDPEVRRHTDAVAFHPYDGVPGMTRPIRAKYPDLPFHLTEKGPNLRKDSAESSLLWWSRTITGALNAGCGSFVGWNYALDENGCPNVGPYDCAGLVEIHSRTGAVTPSIQYQAFRHFAPFIPRGARLLDAPREGIFPERLDCVICRRPDGRHVVVAGNPDGGHASLQIKLDGQYLRLLLPRESLTTLLCGLP